MPDLDFAKPVTLTLLDGSIYTLVRGTWCDTNGIPCDEYTSKCMQNVLDFIEWYLDDGNLIGLPDFLDF